jgi:thiosulfate/3-mercaptopyruvate sulfurtransferase
VPDSPVAADSPLISPEALAAILGQPNLRIVDTRWYLGRPGAGRAAYNASHLPGATYLDVDGDLADPPGTGRGRHPLPDPGAFARRLAELGIGDDDLVVAYDDVGGWVAARLWWMLDDLGHGQVAVLDGGVTTWTDLGLPTTTEIPTWAPARLTLAPTWKKAIDRKTLRDRLGSVVPLDARAGPRYRGETEPIDPVAGHIPTARSAPTDGNLGPNGRFLDPEQLETRFGSLDAAGDFEVVTYCGSGVSATHNALAMRIAGLPDPLLYPGSWSDWSTAGYPVATGPEPGLPPD